MSDAMHRLAVLIAGRERSSRARNPITAVGANPATIVVTGFRLSRIALGRNDGGRGAS
jgi:hypothetical protein